MGAEAFDLPSTAASEVLEFPVPIANVLRAYITNFLAALAEKSGESTSAGECLADCRATCEVFRGEAALHAVLLHLGII
jgi:hypothetical protein